MSSPLEDIAIVVRGEWGNILDVGHLVGLDHKPYCGALLSGDWYIADRIGIPGVVMCGNCILAEVKEIMEPTP